MSGRIPYSVHAIRNTQYGLPGDYTPLACKRQESAISTCAVKTSEVFVRRFEGRIQLEIAPGIAGQSAFETSEVLSIAAGSGLTAQVALFDRMGVLAYNSPWETRYVPDT